MEFNSKNVEIARCELGKRGHQITS